VTDCLLAEQQLEDHAIPETSTRAVGATIRSGVRRDKVYGTPTLEGGCEVWSVVFHYNDPDAGGCPGAGGDPWVCVDDAGTLAYSWQEKFVNWCPAAASKIRIADDGPIDMGPQGLDKPQCALNSQDKFLLYIVVPGLWKKSRQTPTDPTEAIEWTRISPPDFAMRDIAVSNTSLWVAGVDQSRGGVYVARRDPNDLTDEWEEIVLVSSDTPVNLSFFRRSGTEVLYVTYTASDTLKIWQSLSGGVTDSWLLIKTVDLTPGLSIGFKIARSSLTGIGANLYDAVFTWFDAMDSSGENWAIYALRESALDFVQTVATGLSLTGGNTDWAQARNTFGDYCLPALNADGLAVIVHGQYNAETDRIEVHAKVF
jgi:hypothetical protein